MDRDKNLYMFVYRMLLTNIYNGAYKHGEKLPSLLKLCELYGVGRNTVRSALEKLSNDGYVSLQKGVQATVIFDVQDLHTQLRYRQELMNSKAMSEDVYKTLILILPPLGVECFKLCDEKDIEIMRDMLNRFNDTYLHSEAEMIQAMYDIYTFVFHKMNNPILIDLFMTLMSYVYQPLTPERQSEANLKHSTKGIRRMVSLMVKLAEGKKYKASKALIAQLCRIHYFNSMRYINSLCKDLKEEHKERFIWVAQRNQEYLYAQMIVGILNDIATHVYRIDETLPSIAQLSERYHVSDRTTRKALEVLREYKIIETINGIGSKIALTTFTNHEEILQNEGVCHNLLAYYQALQIFSIITRSIIKDATKLVSNDELDHIGEILKKDPYTMASLFDLIYQKTNSCLYTVYKELEKPLKWCSFANMLYASNIEERNEKMNGLIQALKRHDKKAICQCCMEILDCDKEHLEHLKSIKKIL